MSTDVIRAAIDELERVGEWLMYRGGEVSRGQRAVEDAKRAREQLRQIWTDMDRMRNDAEAYRRGADLRRTEPPSETECLRTALKRARAEFQATIDSRDFGHVLMTSVLDDIDSALSKAELDAEA